MNRKRINEFSKKLKALDEELTFKILEDDNTSLNGGFLNGGFVRIAKKRTALINCILIKYGYKTVLKLRMDSSMPAININGTILLYKDSSVFFGDLIKLCGEYLDAFFGDDEHGN